MKKKVLLHIGHGKTATTSIQSTLKHNLSILLDNGFFYPLPVSTSNHNRPFIAAFKDGLESSEYLAFMHHIELDSIDDLRQYYRKWLGNELKKSEASTIVISGEFLPNFTEEELGSIKKFFLDHIGDVDFEILMFSRNPVSYASSAFQQRSRRKRIDKNWIRFAYKKKVSRFINVFGRARVRVFRFEDACDYPGGPVCFFLAKIGLSEDVIRQMNICMDNESMSDLAVDMLTYLNRKIPYTEENLRSGLRRKYEHALFSILPGSKFRLPLENANDVMAEAKSDMVWLQETFGISYETSFLDQVDSSLLFGDDYVDSMNVLLKKASPVLRKVIYEYIDDKLGDEGLADDSMRNLERIRSHIIHRYPWSVKLSYGVLSFPARMTFPLIRSLRKSRFATWLRARMKERIKPKFPVLIGSSK